MEVNEDCYVPIDLKAQFIRSDAQTDFSSLPHYWRRVAGANYYRGAYYSLFGGRESILLNKRISCAWVAVPESRNKWDPCAVRLEINGRKAGYISAKVAPLLYSIAEYWRMQGKKLLLPGKIWFENDTSMPGYDLNAFVAVPTRQELSNHIPVNEIISEVMEWWISAPDEIREELILNGFHLTRNIRQNLMKHRRSLPSVPLPGAAVGSAPAVIDWAFMGIRQLLLEEKAKERAKEKAKEREQFELLVLDTLSLEGTYRATAAKLGISAGTVSLIAKNHGVQRIAHRTEVKRVLERCESALTLQREGKTVAQVSEALNLSSGYVEKLLSDAKFYETPDRNKERLFLADLFGRGELENREDISTTLKARARVDSQVLAFLKAQG